MNKQLFVNKAVYILFAVLFGVVFLSALFFNVCFEYNPVLQIAVMLAASGLLVGATFLYMHHRQSMLRFRYRILAAVVIFIFAVQLIIGLQTIPNPMYDHGKVFWGAVHWATGNSGEEFAVYDNYLHHYPAQMGLFLLLQSLFGGVQLFGLDCFYLSACIVGHLLFAVMTICAFFYLERVVNSDCALFMLLLEVMFLPLYFQSSISYTDTFSVWSIPCTLLLSDLALKAPTIQKHLLYGSICGILLAVGAQIKVTVIIVAIALVIQFIVTKTFKQQLLSLASAAVCFVIVSQLFSVWSYSTVLQKERDGEGMPVTHWLMMGLQGDGSYSSYDEWDITCAVFPEMRVQRNLEVINERLSEMGVGGYLKLIQKKTCRTFGSGTADMSYNYQYQDDSLVAGWVYDIVLQQGRFYFLFNNLSNGMYLLLLLLGVAGACLVVPKKDALLFAFAPFLALVGFWMFMMLWESNHRQLINQWSLFFITGAIGLYLLCKNLSSILSKKQTPATV